MNFKNYLRQSLKEDFPDHWEVNPETGWATIPSDEYPDLSTGGFYLSDLDDIFDAIGPQGPGTGKWTWDQFGNEVFIPDPPKPKQKPYQVLPWNMHPDFPGDDEEEEEEGQEELDTEINQENLDALLDLAMKHFSIVQ